MKLSLGWVALHPATHDVLANQVTAPKKTNSQEMNLLHQLNDGRMNLPAIQGINHRIARVLDGFRGAVCIVIRDAIDFSVVDAPPIVDLLNIGCDAPANET